MFPLPVHQLRDRLQRLRGLTPGRPMSPLPMHQLWNRLQRMSSPFYLWQACQGFPLPANVYQLLWQPSHRPV